jgi:hypothetical protein
MKFIKFSLCFYKVHAAIALTAAVMALGMFCEKDKPAVQPEPPHVFKFQMVYSGDVIWNVADNMNQWSYKDWLDDMENEPADHFQKNMPYVKYMQLLTTTL